MILKFDLKELQTRIGCNLIEDNFIERVLIENYTYKRRDGVDYTSLLKDIFLSEGFQPCTSVRDNSTGEQSLTKFIMRYCVIDSRGTY